MAPAPFPGSLSMRAFVSESKIKMRKKVYIPLVMKTRIPMSVATLTDFFFPNMQRVPLQVAEVVQNTTHPVRH